MRQPKNSETKIKRMVLNALEANSIESCHPDKSLFHANGTGFFVCETKTETKLKLAADNFKPPFKPCKLYDCKGDVLQRWIIDFYVWDAIGKKLVRKKYSGLNKIKDKAKRYEAAKKFIIETDSLLSQGYHLNAIKKQPKKKQAELIPSSPTLLEAFEIIKKLKQATNREGSFKEWKILENVFIAWCKEKGFDKLPVAEIKPEHIAPFIDYVSIERGVNNTTRNNYLIRISTFFNALIKRQIIDKNPLAGLGKLRQDEKQHIPYSKEEIQDVKETIAEKKDWLWLAIQMIYYCFIRPNELIQLKVRHIEGKVFYIPPEISKGKTGRFVPIHPSLWDALVTAGIHKRGQHAFILSTNENGTKQLGKKTLYNTFIWLMRGKLKTGQDLYSFKHSGVIAAYRATKDIKLIQEYCGHKNINDTDKYLRELGLIIPESRLNNIPSI